MTTAWAPFAATSTPPVLWHADDDHEAFELSSLTHGAPPTTSPPAAQDLAHEMSGPPTRSHLANEAAELPGWAEALVRGVTRSESFEVALCCALTIVHIHSVPTRRAVGDASSAVGDSSARDASSTGEDASSAGGGRPSAAFLLPPSCASSFFGAVWRWLSHADGRAQHTAAYVWVELLRLWPAVGAASVGAELRAADSDASLAANIGRFALVWRAALVSRTPLPTAIAAPVVPGIGMMLTLDALQHPSAVVRAASAQWLIDASGAPHSLLRPLLNLLLARGSAERVRLWSLAKLRAFWLHAAEYLALLAETTSPPHPSQRAGGCSTLPAARLDRLALRVCSERIWRRAARPARSHLPGTS